MSKRGTIVLEDSLIRRYIIDPDRVIPVSVQGYNASNKKMDSRGRIFNTETTRQLDHEPWDMYRYILSDKRNYGSDQIRVTTEYINTSIHPVVVIFPNNLRKVLPSFNVAEMGQGAINEDCVYLKETFELPTQRSFEEFVGSYNKFVSSHKNAFDGLIGRAELESAFATAVNRLHVDNSVAWVENGSIEARRGMFPTGPVKFTMVRKMAFNDPKVEDGIRPVYVRGPEVVIVPFDRVTKNCDEELKLIHPLSEEASIAGHRVEPESVKPSSVVVTMDLNDPEGKIGDRYIYLGEQSIRIKAQHLPELRPGLTIRQYNNGNLVHPKVDKIIPLDDLEKNGIYDNEEQACYRGLSEKVLEVNLRNQKLESMRLEQEHKAQMRHAENVRNDIQAQVETKKIEVDARQAKVQEKLIPWKAFGETIKVVGALVAAATTIYVTYSKLKSS